MEDFVLSAFPAGTCDYHFDRENVHFSLYLDSGLFQSEDCNQHLNETMHHHPYYEWFFVTNGSMRLTTTEGTIVLGKNDYVVIRPGVDHFINFLEDGTTRYNMNFSFMQNGLTGCNDWFNSLLHLLGEAPFISGNGSEELAEINKRISQLCGTNRRAMICACFTELLVSVQDIRDPHPSTAALEELLRNPLIDRGEKLHHLFSSYYMYNFSLEKVAECIGLSTRQLNRVIRQEYGCTYHERLSYMRICSAKQLLAKTNFTVGEIAQWVGYSSLCGFYTAFKAQCGCLPTEYRKSVE